VHISTKNRAGDERTTYQINILLVFLLGTDFYVTVSVLLVFVAWYRYQVSGQGNIILLFWFIQLKIRRAVPARILNNPAAATCQVIGWSKRGGHCIILRLEKNEKTRLNRRYSSRTGTVRV